MAKALIKGETHLSTKDKEALMELDLSQFDAIFREGHDSIKFSRERGLIYALFVIGYLLYGATYGKLYFSAREFKQKAKAQDTPFYDDIDATVHETYLMVPLWKRLLLLIVSPLFAGFMLGLAVVPFQWVISKMVPDLLPVLGILAAFAIILFFGFAWALAYFLLIEGEVMADRDQVMAQEIIKTVDTEDFDRIFVSCGGNHRSGIASQLRDEGWDVDEQSTDSWIGKVLLLIDRIVEVVLNPRQTIGQIAAKLR